MSTAYEAIDGVVFPGFSKEELALRYNEWAKDEKYEKDLEGIYNGPEDTAKALAELFPDETSRSDIYILDIGAGSGLLAEKLIQKSFKNIDALEPCEGLLDMAKAKRIYNRTFQTYVTDKPTEIEADMYDAVVSCGAFCENHIPCSGLDEFIRVTKSGGVIVLTMGEYSLNNVAEYKDRLEPMMKEYEKSGKWVSICRKVLPEFLPEYNSVVFVFKVL